MTLSNGFRAVARWLLPLTALAALQFGGTPIVAASGCTVPGAATQVTATTDQSHQVVLSWMAPASAPDGYNVFRGKAAGGETATPINPSLIDGSATSYTDSGLANDDTTYYYEVYTLCGSSNLKAANEASGAPDGPPAAPSSVTALAGDTSCALSWHAPYTSSDLTYTVSRGTATGSYDTFFPSTSSLSLGDANVVNGTRYFYVVQASTSDSADGTSAYSTEVSCLPAQARPGAPANVSGTGTTTAAGVSEVGLTWTPATVDSGHGVSSSFTLSRGTVSGTYSALATGVTGTTYTDTTASASTTYYYVVSAVNGAGSSPNSAPAQVAVPAPPPPVPTGVTLTALDSEVDVAWTATAGTPRAYVVLRSANAGSGFTSIGTPTANAFADRTAVNGNSYYYEVESVYGSATSAPSAVAGPAVPQAHVPGVPGSVAAKPSDAQVTISWTAPTTNGTVSNYSIAYGTASGNYSVTISGIGNNSTSLAVPGLTDGTTYYFVVYATGPGGQGNPSVEVSATPYAVPPAPTALVFGVTPGSATATATISWSYSGTSSSGVVTFQVLRTGTDSSSQSYTVPGSTLSLSDPKPLTNGVTYTYTVTAVNPNGDKSPTLSGSVEPLSSPAVTGQVVDATDTSLSWAAESGAANYTVYRKGPADSAFVQVSIKQTTTSYADASLTTGASYCYEVDAGNAHARSAVSPALCLTPYAVPAAPAPVKLSLTAGATAGSAAVSWFPPVDPANQYGPTFTYNLVRTAPGQPTHQHLHLSVTSMTDPDPLLNGIPYTYTVSATNSAGTSPASNATSVTPVSTPQNLATVAPLGTEVDISWSPVTGANRYTLQVGGATRGVVTSSFKDKTTAPGGTYCYTVTAWSGSATGSLPSAASCVTTPAPPATPTGVTVAAADGQAVITWSESGANSGFEVDYGTSATNLSQQAQGIPTNTATITGLTDNQPYWFTVKATGPGGLSAGSEALSGTPILAPVGVTATAEKNSSASVSWQASPGATGYLVVRTGGAFTETTSAGAATTAVTDGGLVNGTQYTYTVTAINSNHGASVSGARSVKVGGSPPLPSNTLQAAPNPANPQGDITLAFDASSGATGYVLERGTATGIYNTRFDISGPTVAPVVTFDDLTVAPNTTYFYSVVAYNADGAGPLSPEASTSTAPNNATQCVPAPGVLVACVSADTRPGASLMANLDPVTTCAPAPGAPPYACVDGGGSVTAGICSGATPVCAGVMTPIEVCVNVGPGLSRCESVPPRELICLTDLVNGIPPTANPNPSAFAACAGAPEPVTQELTCIQSATPPGGLVACLPVTAPTPPICDPTGAICIPPTPPAVPSPPTPPFPGCTPSPADGSPLCVPPTPPASPNPVLPSPPVVPTPPVPTPPVSLPPSPTPTVPPVNPPGPCPTPGLPDPTKLPCIPEPPALPPSPTPTIPPVNPPNPCATPGLPDPAQPPCIPEPPSLPTIPPPNCPGSTLPSPSDLCIPNPPAIPGGLPQCISGPNGLSAPDPGTGQPVAACQTGNPPTQVCITVFSAGDSICSGVLPAGASEPYQALPLDAYAPNPAAGALTPEALPSP
ncbi:MAG: fibronectin type III domain-containing protein [Candidatus Dormibacteria bacterium]